MIDSPLNDGIFHPATPCPLMTLRSASRKVTRVFDHALSHLGISANGFSVLLVIGRAGAITPSRLATELSMDLSTCVRLLEPLQKNQWIRISSGKVRFFCETPQGRMARKGKKIELTRAGEILLETGTPAWQSAQREIQSFFEGDDLNRALTLLGRLYRETSQRSPLAEPAPRVLDPSVEVPESRSNPS